MDVTDEMETIAEPVVLRYAGELDASRPSVAREILDTVSEETPFVVVDLIDVSFIDSSIVKALVLAHRETAARGGWVRVVYTHHVIRRVIEICGLAQVLLQYPTLDAALSGASWPRLDASVEEAARRDEERDPLESGDGEHGARS